MPFITALEASKTTFHYIVIGAGTAGSAVAARLSENPSVSVLILEAGEPNLNDPKILIPSQYGATFGNPKYDWNFITEKQKAANDKQAVWARGKGLGGSSAMNFYCWVKPPSTDINIFERLGNPGWNWADYQKYMQRVERFHAPTDEVQSFYPHTYDTSARGTDGEIHVTIGPHFHTLDGIVRESFVNSGIQSLRDPNNGDLVGVWSNTSNLDPKTWTRSYAATGYLVPNLERPNLFILTEALVSRIELERSSSGEWTASGVNFIANGETFLAKARKEVILSAGAVNDPKLLELSGIGRSDILKDIGVEQKIDLPGVGENVQEHNFIKVSFELANKHVTLDLMKDAEYAAKAVQDHGEGKGILRNSISTMAWFPLSDARPDGAERVVASLEAELAEKEHKQAFPPGLKEQYAIQLETLKDAKQPDCEICLFPAYMTEITQPDPEKCYFSLLALVNHSFSRGNIHARSTDPFEQPKIDPRYFDIDYDLELHVQHLRFIRKLAETEPFKSSTIREVDPGLLQNDDESLRNYIKNTHSSTWHTAGSCSMLPREKNGVVDSNLKVYGTTNLRVADISIIPLHIAAHTQATAYYIGEKCADIVKSSA